MGAPMAQTEPEPFPMKLATTALPDARSTRGVPVRRIMHDAALEPAKGRRVELGQGHLRYTAICKAEGCTPRHMVGLCKVTGIRTKTGGNRNHLMGAQFAALSAKAGSLPKDEEAAYA